MAEKGALRAIPKSPILERVCVREGAFFGSLPEELLPKGGGALGKGAPSLPPQRSFFPPPFEV